MWWTRVLVLWLILAFFAPLAIGQNIQTLPLEDYASSRDVSEVILRSETYDGPIRREDIMRNLDAFYGIADEVGLRVADELKPSIFLLQIENATDSFREWVFTTRRHSVNEFAIYDITEPEPITLVDSRVPEDNALNIKRYIGYGDVIGLQPGERKLLVVYADIEMMRAVPIEVYGLDEYLDEYYWQTSRFAFILPSIFVLIVINILFFAFLGRLHFIFLASAELCYLLIVIHAANLVDAWGLAAYPVMSVQIGELAKCGFIAFMSLFAINLLDTKQNHPILNRLLEGLILVGLAFTLFWMLAGYVDKATRVEVRAFTWMYAAAGSLIFPVIGILAVRRHGSHFIPLAIGWSAVAIVGLYIFAYVTVLPNLPFPRFVTLLSIIGLQEAFFVTLSVVWKAWKDKEDQRRTIEAYATGLEEQLKAMSRARQLEEQNALATSTIQDQNAMLQASGHDTRQVLLAINTATEYLERNPGPADEDLVLTLKSSAAYLDDILSTTLSAKRTYSTNRSGLALSAFPVEDLLRSLDRIYRPAFVRQSLSFSIETTAPMHLISDRALLMRALSNFIANALQATSEGGVTLSASVSGDRVTLQLQDTGSGIDSKLLDYLMSDDADELASPEGLTRQATGFKIAKSIIEQLHGSLSVHSQVGGGTTLTLTLPCAFQTVTPMSLADMQSRCRLTMIDLDQTPAAAPREENDQIGVSFDDSSQMRGRAANEVALLLYKPLVAELLEHPAVKALKSTRAPALSR